MEDLQTGQTETTQTSPTQDELVGTVIHDTIENALLVVTRVTTHSVYATPKDDYTDAANYLTTLSDDTGGTDSNERRIALNGVHGINSSRYEIKESEP